MVKKSGQGVESIATNGTSEPTHSTYFEVEYRGTSLHSQKVDEGLEFLKDLLESMELTPAVKYKSFFFGSRDYSSGDSGKGLLEELVEKHIILLKSRAGRFIAGHWKKRNFYAPQEISTEALFNDVHEETKRSVSGTQYDTASLSMKLSWYNETGVNLRVRVYRGASWGQGRGVSKRGGVSYDTNPGYQGFEIVYSISGQMDKEMYDQITKQMQLTSQNGGKS